MIKDWRGTPIEVGSKVVYPGRQSSSMWITEATVVDIVPWEKFTKTFYTLKVRQHRTNNNSWNVAGKLSTIERWDRVTVIN